MSPTRQRPAGARAGAVGTRTATRGSTERPPRCGSGGAGSCRDCSTSWAASFPVTRDTWLRRALRALAGWADRRPRVAAGVERLELLVKQPLFGCQACGNCVLSHMEYVCPQTCPKQMRNGPCGGTSFGRCEVVDQPCIWTAVYERAKAQRSAWPTFASTSRPRTDRSREPARGSTTSSSETAARALSANPLSV